MTTKLPDARPEDIANCCPLAGGAYSNEALKELRWNIRRCPISALFRASTNINGTHDAAIWVFDEEEDVRAGNRLSVVSVVDELLEDPVVLCRELGSRHIEVLRKDRPDPRR